MSINDIIERRAKNQQEVLAGTRHKHKACANEQQCRRQRVLELTFEINQRENRGLEHDALDHELDCLEKLIREAEQTYPSA